MMSDNYNLDAIPNTIFDNIIIDNSLNLDEIFDITFMQDPEIVTSSVGAEIDQTPTVNCFEVDMGSIINAHEAITSNVLQHDCMWSGVCQDASHPAKPKNMKFSVKQVCRDFEKELGWTSSSESENGKKQNTQKNVLMINFTEEENTIETHMENHNMPEMFENKLQSLPTPPPQLPSELLVSNVISQVIPRTYTPQTFSIKQEAPANFLFDQYFLPPSTTIKAPPGFSASLQITQPPPLRALPNFIKVEKIEPGSNGNIVKFIPKPCAINQLDEPIIHHKLPPQLKIEPIYIYNAQKMPTQKPLQFLNFGGPVAPKTEQLKSNDLKKGTKKRKTDEKPPKKPPTKKKVVKDTFKDTFNTYNCTVQSNFQKLIPIQKCNSELDDQPLSYEKRNMHNDMERQRRIGMRNLFVELKKAIPTLDDRERVPKVNILKEAISYCEKIKRDENILNDLRRQHNRLIMRAMKLGLSPKSIGSSTSSASSFTGGEEEFVFEEI